MTDLVNLDSVRLDNLAWYIQTTRPADGTEGDAMTDELLTIEQVAAYLKVSKQYAWRLTRPEMAKGEPIPSVKFGGNLRIRLSDLDAWLERRNKVDRG